MEEDDFFTPSEELLDMDEVMPQPLMVVDALTGELITRRQDLTLASDDVNTQTILSIDQHGDGNAAD